MRRLQSPSQPRINVRVRILEILDNVAADDDVSSTSGARALEGEGHEAVEGDVNSTQGVDSGVKVKVKSEPRVDVDGVCSDVGGALDQQAVQGAALAVAIEQGAAVPCSCVWVF